MQMMPAVLKHGSQKLELEQSTSINKNTEGELSRRPEETCECLAQEIDFIT